jgi:signal transduction histidine kinase
VSEICELKYGVRPTWIIDGEPNTTFAYVPVHLEYIITELLKNAFRATVESGKSQEPIIITIAAEPETQRGPTTLDDGRKLESGDPESASIRPFDDPAPGVTIRIRDRGGGISPDVLPNIWSYSFTTFSDADDFPGQSPGSGNMDALNVLSGAGGENSSIAGLGYGLPLGRAYAEYFGGGIAVQSLYGWGSDVYLRLKGLGKPKE